MLAVILTGALLCADTGCPVRTVSAISTPKLNLILSLISTYFVFLTNKYVIERKLVQKNSIKLVFMLFLLRIVLSLVFIPVAASR